MPDPTAPFWLDWAYDRRNADVGTRSRYGNYLGDRIGWFERIDYDDPTTAFASTAWRIATGPIMAPPLVHCHERILGTTVQRNGWDGGMAVAVRLATPLPAALGDARPASGCRYRGYGGDGFFRGDFEGPSEEDLTKAAYLLAETQILWQLPTGTLPTISEVPASLPEIFELSAACLEAIVAGLNREVGPLLERLES
jgi:hypothetical protein